MAKKKTSETIMKTIWWLISPTQEQENLLLELSEAHRILWNTTNEYAREYRKHYLNCFHKNESLEKNDRIKPIVQEFDLMYQYKNIGKFPELAILNVASAQTTMERVVAMWQSYLGNRKGGDWTACEPGDAYAHQFTVMSWKAPQLYMIDRGIRVPQNSGSELVISIAPHANMIRNYKIKKLTITRCVRDLEKPSQYKISATYELPKPETVSLERFMALDLGAGDIGYYSPEKSGTISCRRPDKYWMPKIADVEKRMTKCTKGSRRFQDLATARKTMFKKMADQQLDFERKTAHAIVHMADCIFIGVTSVRLGLAKTKTKSGKVHRGVQNTGLLARLPDLIRQKAIEFGKVVIDVPDPRLQNDQGTNTLTKHPSFNRDEYLAQKKLSAKIIFERGMAVYNQKAA